MQVTQKASKERELAIAKPHRRNTLEHITHIARWALPLFCCYPADEQADKLLAEDSSLSYLYSLGEISHSSICDHLSQSKENYKTLLNCARLADMDNLPSIISMAAEVVGFSAGAAPGFAYNLGEEAIETIVTIPFYVALYCTPAAWPIFNTMSHPALRKICMSTGFIGADMISSLIPFVGEYVDARSIYVNAVHRFIRQEASSAIRADPEYSGYF
jgi:hypothetical protein